MRGDNSHQERHLRQPSMIHALTQRQSSLCYCLENPSWQGEGGVMVKAPSAHQLGCLTGFAVSQGLVSRMCGETSEALDEYLLLFIHVSTNDTTKVNVEHIMYEYRALVVRKDGIVAHVVVPLLLPDNGKESSRCSCSLPVNI